MLIFYLSISFFFSSKGWFIRQRSACDVIPGVFCGGSSYTEAQRSILLKKFSINGYPTSSEVAQIAKEIDEDPERIKVRNFCIKYHNLTCVMCWE